MNLAYKFDGIDWMIGNQWNQMIMLCEMWPKHKKSHFFKDLSKKKVSFLLIDDNFIIILLKSLNFHSLFHSFFEIEDIQSKEFMKCDENDDIITVIIRFFKLG